MMIISDIPLLRVALHRVLLRSPPTRSNAEIMLLTIFENGWSPNKKVNDSVMFAER